MTREHSIAIFKRTIIIFNGTPHLRWKRRGMRETRVLYTPHCGCPHPTPAHLLQKHEQRLFCHLRPSGHDQTCAASTQSRAPPLHFGNCTRGMLTASQCGAAAVCATACSRPSSPSTDTVITPVSLAAQPRADVRRAPHPLSPESASLFAAHRCVDDDAHARFKHA
jgi:hypothetical protein